MNHQVKLRARPVGRVRPGDFELVEAPVPEPGPGDVLLRVLWLSLDPAMRGWIALGKNYAEPVALGAVMRGFTVSEVMRSSHPGYTRGDLVVGMQGWQEYAVSNGSDIHRTIDPALGPASAFLGVLGHTGMTAYVGMLDIGQPRAGETVVVSTAAGAVGSVAGQLARIAGARAVGITGSDAKVKVCLDEFGYDACINYRSTPDLDAALRAACPDGIDVYFDNVGGATLDAVLDQITVGARIVVCGTIGMDAPTGPRVERKLLVARARMQGVLVLDHMHRFDEGIRQLAAWMREGRLRHREEIVDGLGRAPAALVAMLEGRNLGKQLVRVAPS
jgi:NADPH-dependent curcumin reductase CurA